MRIVYVGNQADGIDVPSARIIAWKPGEARDVPDVLGAELLQRVGDFEPEED